MPQINVAVRNDVNENYNVHVFDLFGGGRREVDGSPFALAYRDQSAQFAVNADASGAGSIEYACDGGPSLTNIACQDGDIVSIR